MVLITCYNGAQTVDHVRMIVVKKTARMWEWEEKYLDRQYQFFDLLSQKQDGNVSLTSPSFCTLKASIHRLLFDVAWAAGLQAGYWGRGGSCRLYKRTQAKPFIMALRWCLCIVALRAVQCLCQSHLSCFHMLNYSITCIPWGAGQYCMCNSALGEAQRAKSAFWVKFKKLHICINIIYLTMCDKT